MYVPYLAGGAYDTVLDIQWRFAAHRALDSYTCALPICRVNDIQQSVHTVSAGRFKAEDIAGFVGKRERHVPHAHLPEA